MNKYIGIYENCKYQIWADSLYHARIALALLFGVDLCRIDIYLEA